MSDFLTTFTAVFTAVSLGEVCKTIYNRYIEGHVNKTLDEFDSRKKQLKEKILR